MRENLSLQSTTIIFNKIIIIWHTLEQIMKVTVSLFTGNGKSCKLGDAQIRMRQRAVSGSNCSTYGGTSGDRTSTFSVTLFESTSETRCSLHTIFLIRIVWGRRRAFTAHRLVKRA